MKIFKSFFVILVLLGLFSCVPLKQFNDSKKLAESLQDNNQLLKEENRDLTVENNELDGQIASLQQRYFELEKQFKQLNEKSDELINENKRCLNNQSELEKQIALLKDGSSDEISKLLNELQLMQENLQERENRVRRAEELLSVQEKKLSEAQQELKTQQVKLDQSEKELAQQQARMIELQNALDKQKNAVQSLKEKLNHALRGFYDQGLSVFEKNGKVYVSLEDNLIFKTGSYNLDPKGQAALQSLSEVLANNPNINIMVEGHTDNIPLVGTGQVKDNWDLSVMRATAVTKIILANTKVDPKRITAAGRGEFIPLDKNSTAEARKKNRRTEIILTPDLSEVLEILQSN